MARNSRSSTKWYSRPFCSPGRGERVVYEMDSLSEGSSFKTALMSELLPAPEGAVMTNSLPLPLLNVLHLLAHLLDQQLQFERAIRDLRAGGLGGKRVG